MLIRSKAKGVKLGDLEGYLRGYSMASFSVLPGLLGALEGESEIIDFTSDELVNEWGVPLEYDYSEETSDGVVYADGNIEEGVPGGLDSEDIEAGLFEDGLIYEGDDGVVEGGFEGLGMAEMPDDFDEDGLEGYAGSSFTEERDLSGDTVVEADGGNDVSGDRDVTMGSGIEISESTLKYRAGMSLQEFLRCNGGCAVDEALQYFSKTVIEEGIMMGDVYKRGGRLRA